MGETGSALAFIICAFCFALVIIFKKNEIPAPMRRGLAILAIVMVGFSFFLIIYTFLHMS